MSVIPHSKPWITTADLKAVESVIRGGMLAQGDRTRELELRLAAWLNDKDGVAVGSGSAALVLALHGLDVGNGDEVVLPTYVCASVLEAVLEVGATPILCDVGRRWVMTLADAKRVASDKTAAIIVPHMYGVFADVESFLPMGVPVIEDCAQAIAGNAVRTTRAAVKVPNA